jgi:hypothetical protein
MHEGTDIRGHACKFGDVEAGCRCAAVIFPAVRSLAIDCRLRYVVGT